MTTVRLTKWGNSIGIRIPSNLIKDAHLCLGEALEIKADEKGILTLIPVKNKQDNWLAQFNGVADSDEEDLSLNVSNAFDTDEWTW